MRGQSNHDVPEIVMVTPEMAMQLLDANENNRPLNQAHVNRISRQITEGKWKFNGDTIKLAKNNDVLDGQHRLWAIVEAKQPIETIIVRGIESDAFATIDTLRKPRSGADVLALNGVTSHRTVISTALQWLVRWQRKTLENYRAPINKIENSDIEQAFRDNPGMARAAERANRCRGLTSIGVIAFFYYILTNRNPDLAERMIHTMENPAGVGVNDPFFRLRAYLTDNKHKDPLQTIALMIKAANAASENREMRVLRWANQGLAAETFPRLDVGNTAKAPR